MNTLFNLLFILLGILFIAFLIGLINPSWVLRDFKNPTRVKLFFIWFGTCCGIFVLMALTGSSIDNSQDYADKAEKFINEGNIEKAEFQLSMIDTEDEAYSRTKELNDKLDSLKTVKENIEEEKRLSTLKESLIELRKELESGGVDWQKYRGTVGDLQTELLLFSTYAKRIQEGLNSQDPKVNNLAKDFKNSIARIQSKEFPELRGKYVEYMDKKLWEHDMEVKVSGRGNRIITFTGGTFAANRNIKDFQIELSDVLKEFRFTQARYKWYSGDDEYTYYEMEVPQDEDLIEF